MPKPVLSPEYAEMNRRLHEEVDAYGSGSIADAKQITAFCRQHGLKSILDFGCGKGALKPAVQGVAPDLKVLEFDPAIEGKQDLPQEQVDLIVALDVMEHIEPEYLSNVLETMRDLGPKLVFLVIALFPAKKVLADGRNAHLILESVSWWSTRLAPYFQEIGRAEVPGYFTFVGLPIKNS